MSLYSNLLLKTYDLRVPHEIIQLAERREVKANFLFHHADSISIPLTERRRKMAFLFLFCLFTMLSVQVITNVWFVEPQFLLQPFMPERNKNVKEKQKSWLISHRLLLISVYNQRKFEIIFLHKLICRLHFLNILNPNFKI